MQRLYINYLLISVGIFADVITNIRILQNMLLTITGINDLILYVYHTITGINDPILDVYQIPGVLAGTS
jgi:hypothetical protein